VGEKTGTVYRLGDRVQVRITNVSVDDRKADFEMV
jgi:ribonuclease R